ncbi:MAG: hypothetical protein AB8H86_03080 [Polyangiales bacterium]
MGGLLGAEAHDNADPAAQGVEIADFGSKRWRAASSDERSDYMHACLRPQQR